MRQVPIVGWVLYDDSCGFCRRWIPYWDTTLLKRGLAIAPLQSDWVKVKLQLSDNDLLHDLRLLLVNGDQVVGADVYRYVMRRIWWALPLYILSVAPIFRRIFDWSYRMFATHRYFISKACRLGAVDHK